MTLNQPELTGKALGILRNPATFEWYFIPLLAFVIYIYFDGGHAGRICGTVRMDLTFL